MSTPQLSINIKESDVVSSTSNGFSIIEGTARGRRKVMVEITLDQASTEVVTVDYATADITADSELWNSPDYRSRSGTFTFQPGETKKTFKLEIQQGRLAEDDETFSITLSNAVNAGIPDVPTIITILDDDGGPRLSVSIDESDVVDKSEDGYSIIEGTFRGRRKVLVNVELNEASTETVTVDYNTKDGTANSIVGRGLLADYRSRSGTFTFEPGETKKTFKLEIEAGTLPESNEKLSINLSNATNAKLPLEPTIITIIDDDGAPSAETIISTKASSLVDIAAANFADTGEAGTALVNDNVVTDVLGEFAVAAA